MQRNLRNSNEKQNLCNGLRYLAWAYCIFFFQGNSQDLFAGSGIRRHASFIFNAQRGAGGLQKLRPTRIRVTEMRKILVSSLLFAIVIGLPGLLQAQSKLSSYHNSYFDKTYDVLIDKDEAIYIGCTPDHAKELHIVVDKKQYEDFVKFIENVKQKYTEWDSVAKANGVTDLKKEMGFYSPKFSVAWKSSQWWWSFGHKVGVRFLIIEGKSVAVMSKKVKSSRNEYIDETFYLTFASSEDFDELLSAINIEEGKKLLEKKSNQEDLFH